MNNENNSDQGSLIFELANRIFEESKGTMDRETALLKAQEAMKSLSVLNGPIHTEEVDRLLLQIFAGNEDDKKS